MKKTIITILLTTLVCAGVVYAVDVYTDTTPNEDETIKVISKEYLVPSTTTTLEINMGTEIDAMNADQADIEAILGRFNAHRLKYNDGLTGLKSATKTLVEATCSFPEVPTKVEPVALLEDGRALAELEIK